MESKVLFSKKRSLLEAYVKDEQNENILTSSTPNTNIPKKRRFLKAYEREIEINQQIESLLQNTREELVIREQRIPSMESGYGNSEISENLNENIYQQIYQPSDDESNANIRLENSDPNVDNVFEDQFVHILLPIIHATSERRINNDNKNSNFVVAITDNNSNRNVASASSTILSENLNNNAFVVIGRNGTLVPSHIIEQIKWNTPITFVTSKLLTAVFDRKTLATHTLSGKSSPAFKNLDKPLKGKLNSEKIDDIINYIVMITGEPKRMIRSSITNKCAYESKCLRLRDESKSKNYSTNSII